MTEIGKNKVDSLPVFQIYGKITLYYNWGFIAHRVTELQSQSDRHPRVLSILYWSGLNMMEGISICKKYKKKL